MTMKHTAAVAVHAACATAAMTHLLAQEAVLFLLKCSVAERNLNRKEIHQMKTAQTMQKTFLEMTCNSKN